MGLCFYRHNDSLFLTVVAGPRFISPRCGLLSTPKDPARMYLSGVNEVILHAITGFHSDTL